MSSNYLNNSFSNESSNNSTQINNISSLNTTNCNLSNEEVSVKDLYLILQEANVSGEILLMMLLLSLSVGGGHYLKKLKIRFINEPILATLIGLTAGGILMSIKNDKYINNITTAYVKFFLIILLPPIIFER
jgi:hypothetical protein